MGGLLQVARAFTVTVVYQIFTDQIQTSLSLSGLITSPNPSCAFQSGGLEVLVHLAEENNPDYLLNVGDNFYWGGVFGKCGETPMSKAGAWCHVEAVWATLHHEIN